jgi:hypothetical protein
MMRMATPPHHVRWLSTIMASFVVMLVVLLSTQSDTMVMAQSLATIVPFATEAIGNTIWYAGSAYASSRSRATDGPRNTAKFGILSDIACVADDNICFVADTVCISTPPLTFHVVADVCV